MILFVSYVMLSVFFFYASFCVFSVEKHTSLRPERFFYHVCAVYFALLTAPRMLTLCESGVAGKIDALAEYIPIKRRLLNCKLRESCRFCLTGSSYNSQVKEMKEMSSCMCLIVNAFALGPVATIPAGSARLGGMFLSMLFIPLEGIPAVNNVASPLFFATAQRHEIHKHNCRRQTSTGAFFSAIFGSGEKFPRRCCMVITHAIGCVMVLATKQQSKRAHKAQMFGNVLPSSMCMTGKQGLIAIRAFVYGNSPCYDAKNYLRREQENRGAACSLQLNEATPVARFRGFAGTRRPHVSPKIGPGKLCRAP